jgi:CheY-like chemotaxis protein
MWKALPEKEAPFIFTFLFNGCMSGFENLHIVIAEDDFDDGEIVIESFSKHQAFSKVDWVRNGRELLAFLDNCDSLKPDVILTDINMPILNGIEALQEIHENQELRHIPVFVYSSTINPIYEVKCKELGTKAFLMKPFNLDGFDDIPKQIIATLKTDRRFVEQH